MSSAVNTPAAAAYPACWPGTAIIKSVHTAFNWRQTGHDQCSEFARNPVDRVPLYNQWLNARATAPCSTPDWPQYRDTHTAPARRGPKKKDGIGHNNGTMHGLTKRADKLLQPRAALPGHMSTATQVTPMHMARAPKAKPAKPANHGGAYSKAVAA